MAKTAQILLLLLVAVAVQSYGGRRIFRGRSHGRYRNPYDYYHHRRHSEERPHSHSNKYHQINSHYPGDSSDSTHIAKHSAEPDRHHVKDLESTTAADPPLSDPTSIDNANSDSDDSDPNSGEDLPGSDNNDKPDDVTNVNDNGESPDSVNSDKPDDVTNVKAPDVEKPDNISDNINGNEPSSEENPNNTIDVNGMSPGGDEDNPNPSDSDNSSDGNLSNMFDNPQDTIEVNGLKPDDNKGSSSNELPNGENVDGYLNNDKKLPKDNDDKSGDDNNNFDNGESQPNENDGDINVNGLSPGDDSNEPKDGDEDSSGSGSIDVNGLSPGGDNSESDDKNININGLSPGGDDTNGLGIDVHGGLSNDVLGKPNQNNTVTHGLEPDHHNHQNHAINNPDISDNNDGFLSGHGSIGAHVDLPNLSGHVDLGGLLPKPSGHIIDHDGLKPDLKPDLSGNIDSHITQPVLNPDISGHITDLNTVLPHPEGIGGHPDSDQPQIHPIFPGNDILPNPGDYMPQPMPNVHGKPDNIPSIDIPGLEGNNGKKNNSMMIPVQLPGGGHIMVNVGALGNIPSYIIVMINGQPTLIQNPAGLGIGGGNAGSFDFSSLLLGNNAPSIGINSGVLPSWLNLGGLGGNGGLSIGGGSNIGILPNKLPIWIGSQLPNFGGGGGAGGSYIIPNNEPVQPVPVPIPVPRPLPPPQPIYPASAIPIPEPIEPAFTYPGFPWPSMWKPSNPNVNVNFTHMLLTPNEGSSIDLKSLFDILANIDSRLPKPQSPRPKEPTPQPNYPLYPEYPYIYPPPFPYPLYPYLPDYLYPKPTGPGKNVPSGEETLGEKDPSNPHPIPRPGAFLKPRPLPEEPRPEPLPEEPHPEPLPEEPHPEPLPEEPHSEPLPEEPHPEPLPEEPHPEPLPEEPRPEPLPEEPHPEPLPEEPHPEPLPEEPHPEPLPEEPHPVPLPEEPHPEPLPEEPHPEPLPEEPHPEPLPEEPQPEPLPEEPHPEPLPEEPHPEPFPEEPQPEPLPEKPLPEPLPEEPQPEPLPEEPQPEPLPEEPQPEPLPEEPHPEPLPEEPHSEPVPEKPRPEPLPEEPHPEPLPEEHHPEPLPEEPHPVPLPDEPHPVPLPEQPRPEPVPIEPHPEPGSELPPDVPVAPHKDTTPRPEHQPKPHPGHPDHHPQHRPVIDLPDISITLPKPSHIGTSKPGHDSGLIDILNVLLKFPDRNSHRPKNIEPIIKLLLAILKPGDKPLIPNLDNSKPDLGSLSHLLLHLLDGRNEPNLFEPGMDEGTRANLMLLLELLANNLGGNSYPMGYYQPENPLLYFLGHFPCDHPNIPSLSGMQSSSSNLWQLLANMYGHNYEQEFRLERSAEQTEDADDKSAGEANKIEAN